jgi:hypothetical protein
MFRNSKEVRYMPLWQGPLHAPSVSTSLDPFGCLDRQKVQAFSLFPFYVSLTHREVSGWQSLKGYAMYKGHTLDPQFIRRLMRKEGGVSAVANVRPNVR